MQLSPGGEIRLTDYYENEQESLEHYVNLLRSKNYVYGTHLAPHDIKVKELGTGRPRIEVAEKLGLRFDRMIRLREDAREDRLFVPH